jgi:hypothetical protein
MPTFQPRFYEDRYPIGRFVLDRANALGLTRRQLVERLGFADRLAKGHRVLSEILLTGTVPPYVTALADALEIDQSLLNAVLSATARQQEAEWMAQLVARESNHRDRFRPHLQVRTERRMPSPIFVAALLGTERLLTVYLPEDINSAEENERHEIVRGSIQKHYQESDGHVLAFGRVVGYNFIRFAGFGADDFGIEYDVNGSRIGDIVALRRVPEATLGTKRGDTRLTGLLKDDPIETNPILDILYGDIDVSDLRDPRH